MAKKKTSKKRLDSHGGLTGKTIKIRGVEFLEWDPAKALTENPDRVLQGLLEALADGDKEAFQEILEGYVKARNILKMSRETKLSRNVIYQAIDKKKDPRLGTICKILSALRKAA